MKFTKKELLYGAGLLIAGLFLGWLLFSSSGNGSQPEDLDEAEMEQHVDDEHTDEEGNIVYTCSMHPSVRESEPGNCPICGMELIPVDEADSETEENEYSMVMTAASAELARIQTAPVTRGTPEKELNLPGRIEVDERALTSVTAWFPGRIEDVKVDFTGAPIRKGEVMATIYSPELISAQRELLEAARQRERNPRLYESSRQKFRLWGFSDALITDIIEGDEVRQELEITSPVDGYVLSRNVADLDYVQEGSVLFEVADLSRLWVMLEAYEEDLPWIETGDEIMFHSRSNPGERFSATVSYIDPVVDPQKRTVGIRANLENAGEQLKPDMLVRGTLSARMDSEKLMIPASAVLWTGPRSLVYVQDTSAELPRFEVREVELGARAGDYYVIEEGLQEGEEVVFNGNFRIDSEFQLADKFSMMNREPGSGARPGGHDHGNMDEEMEMDDTDNSENGAMDEQQDMDSHENSDAIEGATDDFREEFRALLDYYLDGKGAFFESDSDAADRAFQQVAETLESIGLHRMEGDAHERWIVHYEAIESHTDQLLSADGQDGRKEQFARLSQVFIEAVKNYQIPGVIYQQYCPMEDASWLSRKEQIANPYMESMPSCGEIIERIES